MYVYVAHPISIFMKGARILSVTPLSLFFVSEVHSKPTVHDVKIKTTLFSFEGKREYREVELGLRNQ